LGNNFREDRSRARSRSGVSAGERSFDSTVHLTYNTTLLVVPPWLDEPDKATAHE
jgi:hypothetical protein